MTVMTITITTLTTFEMTITYRRTESKHANLEYIYKEKTINKITSKIS